MKPKQQPRDSGCPSKVISQGRPPLHTGPAKTDNSYSSKLLNSACVWVPMPWSHLVGTQNVGLPLK